MARIIDQQKKNLIGERVRFYRIQRGYSQQQLADKLETLAVYICRGSISRIEDYSRTVTDLELVALAEILQVAVFSDMIFVVIFSLSILLCMLHPRKQKTYRYLHMPLRPLFWSC